MKQDKQADYPDEVIDSLIQHDQLQQAMGLKAFSDYELKHYADEIMNANVLGQLASQGQPQSPEQPGMNLMETMPGNMTRDQAAQNAGTNLGMNLVDPMMGHNPDMITRGRRLTTL